MQQTYRVRDPNYLFMSNDSWIESIGARRDCVLVN